MEAIHRLPASSLHDAFLRGAVGAAEITRSLLDRAAAVDSRVNAFLHLDADAILERAEALDRRRAGGERLGALAAVPVAIKDNIATRGVPTTCGSRMLRDYRSPYDAHVIEALLRADAILFGRTNLDEFAMGSTGETSAFGCTRNPWRLDRVPGGSSSGSAAAVAARLVPLALGTDTGGSIRFPAALCGVIGLKPTYGRVSRYGLVAHASSLDQIGPLARTADDAARLLRVIAGRDPRDATSVDAPVGDFRESGGANLEGLRVVVPPEFLAPDVEAEVRSRIDEALRTLASLGARIEETPMPGLADALAAYYLVATAEASSNLARFDGVHYGHRNRTAATVPDLVAASRAEGFGREVVRRIVLGTFALSAGYHDAYYGRAERIRSAVRSAFEDAFARADVIVGPTAPVAAFPLGTLVDDPPAMYRLDRMTVAASLAGLPAVSVPAGFTTDGLPVGLHAVAAPFAETRLLGLAGAFLAATGHHLREPPL